MLHQTTSGPVVHISRVDQVRQATRAENTNCAYLGHWTWFRTGSAGKSGHCPMTWSRPGTQKNRRPGGARWPSTIRAAEDERPAVQHLNQSQSEMCILKTSSGGGPSFSYIRMSFTAGLTPIFMTPQM